jgi:hypothetical protein
VKTPAEIVEAGAGLVLFSSEPFAFAAAHLGEFRVAAGCAEVEGPRLRLCRGDLVGWYPSRLPAALTHLAEILES